MISVLVADDSIFIRKRISRILESDRRISVVGTASNGAEAIEKVKELQPDVITLDVEMPVLNGLEALDQIVKEYSTPVIMLSALTKQGAEVTLKALELGAFDFIPKPATTNEDDLLNFSRDLILKIRSAAVSRLGIVNIKPSMAPNEYKNVNKTPKKRILIDKSKIAVAIGISTGGPRTLLDVIPKIPKGFPGSIFIAQHMPEGFTASLAERLNSISALEVREAKNGDVIKPSVCYIAPGGRHMKVQHMSLSKGTMIKVTDEPVTALYKPSADVLMTSVAEVYGGGAIGIVMTGMGRDGTKGMHEIKQHGGTTISEDKSTCIVYGMPKSVEEAGLSDHVVPANNIPQTVMELIQN